MTAAWDVAINPYPGLRPFDEQEEHLFFGRERQIDRMINLLAEHRFLAVVGGSGSGKSSLVNCGLQPALRRGLMAKGGTTWRMARFRPGLRPIDALAQALATNLSPPDGDATASLAAAELSQADVIATQLRLSRLGLVELAEQASIGPHATLLVVVDQFEEIFRYQTLAHGPQPNRTTGEPYEAQALVNLLLATASHDSCPVHVVLTMRSDFLGDCAQFPGLPEAITAALHLVPRLSREERRQVIALPALVSGTQVDPVLITKLVNDVGDDPDQLSLLQHALRRTWAHWHERGGQGPITLADYEAIGTMTTALERHAEQALAEVAEGDAGNSKPGEINADLALAARLFRALTDKASDPRGIRRPTTLADLQAICGGEPAAVEHQVNHFRQADRAFLMPPEGDPLRPDSVVDISHESLMRVWRRLDTWADQEADAAALFLRLADTANRHGLGEASLWRDPELQLALNWRQHEQPNEAWAQRYATNYGEAMAFLEASRAAREAEQRQIEWRRRRALAGLVVFSLLATGVGGFSWWQWQITRISRARAYAASAADTLEQRPLQSMLYSLAALERLGQEPAEALGAAYTLAQASLRNWEVEQWEINPDGSGRVPISGLLALPDGTAITAAGCGPGPAEGLSCLQRWRGSTPVDAPMPTGQEEVTVLLQLAGGQLVTGGGDGSLRLWQRDRTLVPIGDPQPASDDGIPIHSLVQLGDGEIVSGDQKGRLRRWRLVKQAGRERLEPIGAPITTGVSSIVLLALPNGALLSGGADPLHHIEGAGLQLWRKGRPVGPPLRTGQTVVKQLLLWGDQVLSVGSEGAVARLSTNGGTPQPLHLPGRGGRTNIDHLTVVAGGGGLLSVHLDGNLRLWRSEGSQAGQGAIQEMAVGQADSNDLVQMVHLKGGELLALDGNDKLHRIRHPDPNSDQAERTGSIASGHNAVNALLARPGNQLISGGSEDGRLCFWNVSDGIKPLVMKAGEEANHCLSSNLKRNGGDQEATGIVLAPMPGDAMLSATNITLNPGGKNPKNTVVIQYWRLPTGQSKTAWTTQAVKPAQAWGTMQEAVAIGEGEVLSLGSRSSDPTRRWLWRWSVLRPDVAVEGVALRNQQNQGNDSPDWLQAVVLPGGALLSAAPLRGTLQRWHWQGRAALRPTETIDTGLDSIGALALLPDGRHVVIASGQQSGAAASVQVFDLLKRVWVGQPIPVPRPIGQARGTVAATALAVLPDNGVAIGTNRGGLLTIQPRRIQAEACRELASLLTNGSLLQRSRSGLPTGVTQFARSACGL